MVDVSNKNVPRHFLLLKVTFQAKRCVAFVEQSLVNGAVRRMADYTTLAQGLMFVHPWPTLSGVTLEAGFVSTQKRKAAGFERLLNIGAPAFDRHSLMRVVTIRAAHFAFGHWVVVRQLELRAHFQVTLEASLRRFSRINNRVGRAT